MIAKLIFSVIRFLHTMFFAQNMPEKVSLYFHDITDKTVEDIEAIKYYFESRGYTFAFPNEMRPDSEFKQLYISFDDNYISWFNNAKRLIQLGIKPTIFVNTIPVTGNKLEISEYYKRIDYHGIQEHIDFEKIQFMSDLGFNIGAHTHSHFNLSQLTLDEAIQEITKNKELLEKCIGKEVNDFSFPFGMPKYFNDELHQACLDIGFKTISYATPGMLYEDSKLIGKINRTPWFEQRSFKNNLKNLTINGRLFVKIFGKSPIG